MSRFFDSAVSGLGYLLSLPERTVRSLAAVAGGTTSLLTDTLFPDALRGTTLYKIFVGDTQRFVIEKVAQVQRDCPPGEAEAAASGDYVQRKMIGGALEAAGLFAMHFSPLWVFAIAGDAAAGGHAFLDRLATQLKKNNVIPADLEVSGIADLLGAIHETSRQSAAAIDTPPLSAADLSKLADDMVNSYGQVFTRATNLVPRIETLWTQMEKLADRENLSIETLSGILTIDVAQWGKKGIGAVWALGQTGTELFGENVLDSYARTLGKISEQGVTAYLTTHMAPFWQAATGHFDPGRKTWTQWLLHLGKEAEQVSASTPAEPEITPPSSADAPLSSPADSPQVAGPDDQL